MLSEAKQSEVFLHPCQDQVGEAHLDLTRSVEISQNKHARGQI